MSYSSFSTHAPLVIGPISLSPWANFDKAWTVIMGYPAHKFKFVTGQTPMSTLTETVSMIALYLIVIFGGREFMRNRQPLKLNGLFMAHNLCLTVISGSLLVLFAEQLIPTLWRHGLYENICGGSGWTPPLVLLYYLNYLVKYFELIDTVFLMVKKKPLIHVVMYWYYFQSARGVRVSWKEWITRLQIAQFVIDLGFVYFASWDYFTSTYAPSLPHVGTCAGEPLAAVAGDVILSSYLVLFISFYIATYKKMSNRRDTAKVAHKAELRMEKTQVPTVNEVTEKASKIAKATGFHRIS
ncbi:Fatty-acid synthase [Hyphodiscus hymeniophilus]|uniref:Elongation of fatty acids protein n=1 Tax=Hyphodiscus hymeniophilus TaxID=353542 RepID=A0A9P6VCH9_9HELO|nr:Fatty-acid synthase [Hyphodiscus hymeniophilus]